MVSSTLRGRASRLAMPLVGDPLLLAVIAVVVAIHAGIAIIGGLGAMAGSGEPWSHWDAVYYVRLAQHGYQPYVHGSDHTGLAFFPLFPLALALPIALGIPPYLASFALANLFAVVACGALLQLARREFGDDVAARSVVLLAAAPAAAFLTVGYGESLFLALAIGSMALLRGHRWTEAAVLCGLAAATRPTGILLVLSYLVEWWCQYRRSPRSGLRALAPLPLIALPLLATAAYDASIGASPLASLHMEQTVWHYSWAWPWDTLARHVAALGTLSGPGRGLMPVALLNLAAALLALPLLVAGLRVLPAAYNVYSIGVYLLTVGISSAAPFYGADVNHPYVLPLLSTHRLLLAAFPLAMAAALVLHPRLAWLVVIAVSLVGQFGLAYLFFSRLWAG
jgi:hypothetical protein